MFEDSMEDSSNSLVKEIDKDMKSDSEEAINVICDVLNSIPDLDGRFQKPGYMMNPFASGTIGNYKFQIRPKMGVILAFNDNNPSKHDHYYKYNTIQGAVGWILCKSGYGNNLSRYESFTTFLEPEKSFPGLRSSMEKEPSPEEQRRYEKVLSSIKKNIVKGSFSKPGEGMGGGAGASTFSLGEGLNKEDDSEDE